MGWGGQWIQWEEEEEQEKQLWSPESSLETAANPGGYVRARGGNRSPRFPLAYLAVLDGGSSLGTHHAVPSSKPFPFTYQKQHSSSSKRSGLGAGLSQSSLGAWDAMKDPPWSQRVPLLPIIKQAWVGRHLLILTHVEFSSVPLPEWNH